jgi:hypothetical protein
MLGQIVTSAIGVGQLLDWVGFRFAPKLHGILTKAQAVLQLFSFAILIWACISDRSVCHTSCHFNNKGIVICLMKSKIDKVC